MKALFPILVLVLVTLVLQSAAPSVQASESEAPAGSASELGLSESGAPPPSLRQAMVSAAQDPPGGSAAQQPPAEHDAQHEYEARRKEPMLAFLLGLVPGVGSYYAGDIAAGSVLLGLAVGGAVLFSSDSEDLEDIGRAMLITTAVVSPIHAGLSANAHNKRLRRELGLAVRPSLQEPAMAVVVRF